MRTIKAEERSREIKESTRRAYNRVAGDYDRWYWSKRAQRLRSRLTDIVVGRVAKELYTRRQRGRGEVRGEILDVGCGSGHLVPKLSTLGRYTGLDIAENMVSYCRSRYGDYEGKFVVGDAEDMPFGEGEFDCVICFWTFHHFPDPEVALREMWRVLKPGGFTVIATFGSCGVNPFPRIGDWISSKYWGFQTRRYSKAEMLEMLQKCGFRRIEGKIIGEERLLRLLGINFIIVSGTKGLQRGGRNRRERMEGSTGGRSARPGDEKKGKGG